MIVEKILGSEKRFNLEDRILNAVMFVAFLIGLLSLISDLSQELGGASYIYVSFTTIGFGILYFLGRRKPNSKKLVWPFIVLDITPTFFFFFFFDGISGTSLYFILSLIFVVPVITTGIERIIAIILVLLVPISLFIIELNNSSFVGTYKDHKTELIDTFLTFTYIAIGYIIVIILIISAYRRQREKLEFLNRSKDKFFSIIAHDLKTPIGNIMQLGELIWKNQDSYNRESLQEILYNIHSSSKNTYNLLDNLLQWARSETGYLKTNPIDVSLKQIAEDNYKLMEEKANAKEINIQLNSTCNSMIYADKNMLNTVVRNLISNAIKFTPIKGSIEISTFCDSTNKLCKLHVKDNGVGIKKEAISGLFDIDSDYTTRGTNNEGGTGLGLKLCKEFTNKNNGTIEVSSEENNGTIITISFPCINNYN